MNAFFDSNSPIAYSYGCLILNIKINNLHYRALRIIYREDMATSEELLKNDGSLTIHQKNIHYLVTEMYKVKNELAHSFMKDICTPKDLVETECNTRNKTSFHNLQNSSSSTWGLESLKHLRPRLWKMVPKHKRSSFT